jgi:4-amino-4-deoxy-L-arabinose transferase-like glycosyltransferase
MRSRARSGELLAWILVCFALAAMLRGHLILMWHPAAVQVDEPYIIAFANRMLDGRFLPYVDAVSHRGPLLYWAVASMQWLLGDPGWMPIRICAAVAGVSTVLFTFLAGRAAGRPLVGAIAAWGVVLTALFGVGLWDGMSFNGEHLLNAFASASLWLTVVALRPAMPDKRYLFGAGVCAALTMLSKQNGAIVFATLGTWVLFTAWARPALERSTRFALIGVFAAGAALPLALTIGIYAAAGELDAFYYWTVVYNRDVYMGPYTSDEVHRLLRNWFNKYTLQLSVSLLLVVWGLTRPLAKGRLRDYHRRWDADGFTPTVALGALLSLLACNGSLRDFLHYYVQLAPWFALLFALVLVEALAQRQRRRQLIWVLALAPMVLVTFGTLEWNARHLPELQRARRGTVDPVCRLLDQHTKRGDAVFVWGFRADLYVYCQRKSASRYVFTTFVAGVVPWFDLTREEEDRWAVPHSREILLGELEETKPAVIVDAPKSLLGRSMTRYAVLADYLERAYCPPSRMGQLKMFIRKRDGRCSQANRSNMRGTPLFRSPKRLLRRQHPAE